MPPFVSDEFTDQGSGGLICFHSLKNPTYPEYVIVTSMQSSCMCLLVVFPFPCQLHLSVYTFLPMKRFYQWNEHTYVSIFLPATTVWNTWLKCYPLPPARRYIFETPSGVMCLDIHPEHPYLVAAGLYDGTVLVYDLQENSKEAIYKATANTGKHSDPVWQVRKSLQCVRVLACTLGMITAI